MSSEDSGGPPAAPDRVPFPFLRKGSATQKYNGKVSFLHNKSLATSGKSNSAGSLPRTSPTQSTSGGPERRSMENGVRSTSNSNSSIPPFRATHQVSSLIDDLDVAGNMQTTQSVPRLNLTSPVPVEARTDRDSGRGSRNSPPEGRIYQAPSHRRTDSGLGEDGPPSPRREGILNARSAGSRQELASSSQHLSDEVFAHLPIDDRTMYSIIPESNRTDSFSTRFDDGVVDEATLHSLIEDTENGEATENQSVADSAAFHDNTSQFERVEQRAEQRVFSPRTLDTRANVVKSAPLAASDRASLTDYSRSDSGMSREGPGPERRGLSPWTSTPLASVNGEPSETRLQRPGETAILHGTPEFRENESPQTRPASSEFQMDLTKKTDGSSLADERRFIAANDRPLHEAFPTTLGQQRPQSDQREPTLPSQSTRYHPIQPAQVPPTVSLGPRPRDPRVTQLRQQTQPARVDRSVQMSRDYTSSSSGSVDSAPRPQQQEQVTPFVSRFADRNALPARHRAGQRTRAAAVSSGGRGEDAVVAALKRQLRNTIVHLDYSFANMKKEHKKMKSSYDSLAGELDQGRVQLATERSSFEKEVEEWRTVRLREQNQLKRDRDALNKRERELLKTANDKSDQTRTTLLKASTKDAELRTKLRERDDKIKELTEKLERCESAKARAERTNNVMKANHERTLKTKEAEMQQLRAENNAATKRNGLAPRPRESAGPSRPSETVQPPASSLPSAQTTPKKQVQFDARNTVHRFVPDESWDTSSSSLNSSTRKSLTRMNVVDTFDRPQKGLCWQYEDEFGTDWAQMYQLRHNDGVTCGSKLYQYKNADMRWTYGPIEVYYHGHTRLQVDLHSIGVRIVCFFDQVNIYRPRNEISRYVYKTREVTETRLTKNGRNMYALIFNGRNVDSPTMERCGQSDRSIQEDKEVLRRGTLDDMREHMRIQDVGVSWQSHHLPAVVTAWGVSAAHVDGSVQIQVEMGGDVGFKINFYPTADWVLIRHMHPTSPSTEKVLCCDMGKKTRDRERRGVYLAAEPPMRRPI